MTIILFVGCCLLDILLPQFMLAHYLKANDVNDANKRRFKWKEYKQK